MKRLVFISTLLILSLLGKSEGTKEFGDFGTERTGLWISLDDTTYSPFAFYNAPEEYQLKLSIAEISETVYFGMHTTDDVGDPFTMPFRIVGPDGTIVFTSNTPSVGDPGYINNYLETAIGPDPTQTLGGYVPLSFSPTQVGEYVIEFNPDSTDRTIIRYFDMTVVDALNDVKTGRLHSKGWQLSAGGYDPENAVNAIVYPYHPSGVIFEVDLNGIIPWVFSIYFNSFGTDTTGNFLIDRKSKVGRNIFPEFDVFLNPPDQTIFPVKDSNIEYEATLNNNGCESSEFCLDFKNSSVGVVDGFIDFNQNNVYEPDLGDLSFEEIIDSTGQTCIEWNGLDANGNMIGASGINLVTRFGSGIMHLPLYDIERNRNGYTVEILEPSILPDPLIYWDDSLITAGVLLGSPLIELDGCNSQTSGGCHKWDDRGEIGGTRSLQETINTWWFTQIEFDTVIFNYTPNTPVEVSFNADTLLQETPTLCAGDEINVYVFNNGENHYDTSRYNYEWYLENTSGTPVALDSSVITLFPENDTKVILRSIFKLNPTCTSSDTIDIRTTTLFSTNVVINDENCLQNSASASVSFDSEFLNPTIFWNEFPGFNDSSRTDLLAGEYTISIVDSSLSTSERCTFDTTFTVEANSLIDIIDVSEDSTFCFDSTGSLLVEMANKEIIYEYSWNGSPFSTSDSTIHNLQPGNYTVTVRDSINGCTVDTTTTVNPIFFAITATSQNEICSNETGEITINAPITNKLTIIWSDTTLEDLSRNNLSAGTYDFSIFSNLTIGCRVDTTIIITDSIVDAPVALSFDPNNSDRIKNFICDLDTVSFFVLNDAFHYDDANFSYQWFVDDLNSAPIVTNQEQLDLIPTQNSKVYILSNHISGPACSSLDSLEINVTDHINPTLNVNDTICTENVAHASLSFISDQNPTVIWNEFPGFNGNSRTDLTAGEYSISIVDPNYSEKCGWDTTFTVDANLLIEIESIVNDSTFCYDSTGNISVSMVNKTLTYEYSWNNEPFDNRTGLDNLIADDYNVTIRDSLYGCTVDTIIPITPIFFEIDALMENEMCSDGTGAISIFGPNSTKLSVTWNDTSLTSLTRTGLSQGNYSVTIFSNLTPGCSADSTFNLTDSLPIVNDFRVSFEENNLVTTKDFICDLDTVDFFIFNGDTSHYNDTRFTYNWYYVDRGNLIGNNVSSIQRSDDQNYTIIAEAILNENNNCIYEDSLLVTTALPITASLTITDTICIENRAEAELTINVNGLTPVVTWNEFPGFSGLTRTDLIQGTYTISVNDLNYSDNCTFDTSFTVEANKQLAIESIIDDSTFCYDSTGNISVTMVNKSIVYEYSWDGATFSNQSSLSNLQSGDYTVNIRDVTNGCTLDTIIPITPIFFEIDALMENEMCSDGAGAISVFGPNSTKLSVTWNDTSLTSLTRTGLSQGNYSVTIFSNLTPGCFADSTFNLTDSLPVVSEFRVSFEENNLVTTKDFICDLDTVDFFIFNGDSSHYNDTIFTYNWYYVNRTNLIGNNVSFVQRSDDQNYTIIAEAILNENNNCIYEDSLSVTTALPITASLEVADTICTENRAEAELTINANGLTPVISWNEFPGFSGLTRTDLTQGNYTISANDVNYSDNCTFDTSFTVEANKQLAIESIINDSTFCYDSTGNISVTTVNKSIQYLYSWNSEPRISLNNLNDLPHGDYSVTVFDTINGCQIDTIIPVQPLPVEIQIVSTNSSCTGDLGSINLTIPSSKLSVTWNDTTVTNLVRENLIEGSYNFTVSANGVLNCHIDSNITILYEDRPVTFENVEVIPTDCANPTGSASIDITPFAPDLTYIISWDNGTSFGGQFSRTELGEDTYEIVVRENGTDCMVDTTITIVTDSIGLNIESTNTICTDNLGSIDLNISSPKYTILWDDDNTITSFRRDNLFADTYSFSLLHSDISSCNFTGSTTVNSTMNDLNADFSIEGYTGISGAYLDEEVTFNNESTPTPIVQWNIGTDSVYNTNNPTHTFSDEGDQLVILYVEDEFGCHAEKQQVLKVQQFKDCKMVLPDAFSPNNDDFNDDIGVLGYADQMELKIYDRWGEIVFKSVEQSDRWDGNYLQHPGKLGIYVYLLKYSCNDLRGNFTNIEEVGEITLVR